MAAKVIGVTVSDLSRIIADAAEQRRSIPENIFPEVRKWSHMPTANFILTRYGPKGFEFALGRSTQQSESGELVCLGDCIFPGMTPMQGLLAACQKELGFTPSTGDISELLWQSVFHHGDERDRSFYFTMSCCWQVWVEYGHVFDRQTSQSELCWFTKETGEEFPFFVREAVSCLRLNPARDLGRLYNQGEMY
jgi:hypothetical protein